MKNKIVFEMDVYVYIVIEACYSFIIPFYTCFSSNKYFIIMAMFALIKDYFHTTE
jgi:hypothetical protein